MARRRRRVEPRTRVSEILAFGIGGIALAVGVAFIGHHLGQQANARSVVPAADWQPSDEIVQPVSPVSTIVQKSSLLEVPLTEDLEFTSLGLKPRVLTNAKADFIVEPDLIKPERREASLQQLITTPTVLKMQSNWSIGRERKKKIIAKRRVRLAEKSCLSRAIYFEARSESELGQLAVAKVILNRVEDESYPDSICGVVYQGAERKNSCQFSFACDGIPDNPKAGKYWDRAERIADRAMSGKSNVQVISTATHYHADYVKPKWSSAMRRLIKIGRHIFYHDS